MTTETKYMEEVLRLDYKSMSVAEIAEHAAVVCTNEAQYDRIKKILYGALVATADLNLSELTEA